jgi:hypothetical protein
MLLREIIDVVREDHTKHANNCVDKTKTFISLKLVEYKKYAHTRMLI